MAQGGRFRGKLAVVTASTAGIGLGIARQLAQEGARVVISSRHQHRVQSVVESLKAEGLDAVGTACHVGNAEQRRALVEFAASEGSGKIDILVLNAASNPAPQHGLLEMPEWAIDKVVQASVPYPNPLALKMRLR